MLARLPLRLSQGRYIIFPLVRTQADSTSPASHAAVRPSAANLNLPRPFSTTSALAGRQKTGNLRRWRREKERKKSRRGFDPYGKRLAEAAKAAFLARRAEILRERLAERGDPIHGAKEPTPFLKSFDVAMDLPEDSATPKTTSKTSSQSPSKAANDSPAQVSPLAEHTTSANVALPAQLNHFATPSLLKRSLAVSRQLTTPPPPADASAVDPLAEAQKREVHARAHGAAATALARIVAVEGASSDQRTRINAQRCVERFGRHNTDERFRQWRERNEAARERGEDFGRIGPDTGSSEVQIAILTAKIRVLAAEYAGRSRNDKANKRNLRLLLHRRQKLCKYFMKRDRGGKRWQHLVSTLGLTPANWEGEIELR